MNVTPEWSAAGLQLKAALDGDAALRGRFDATYCRVGHDDTPDALGLKSLDDDDLRLCVKIRPGDRNITDAIPYLLDWAREVVADGAVTAKA